MHIIFHNTYKNYKLEGKILKNWKREEKTQMEKINMQIMER